MTRLPSPFTSLFRLFLRTTSATVLHHTAAKHNLRKLWRPSFTQAARVIRQLENVAMDASERDKLQIWLDSWERRMDNTLSMLYTSAQSRGLPHKLTRNLSLLLYANAEWWERRNFSPTQYWNPRLPPSSPRYHPPQMEIEAPSKKDEKITRRKDFDDKAWGALGQVVRMAEGRHHISLGTMTLSKRKSFRRKR